MQFCRLCGTLALVLLGCNSGSEPSRPERPKDDGHQRMLALLREIDIRTADEHPLLGEAALRNAQAELAFLPRKAPSIRRFSLEGSIGYEHLRLGNNEQAIRHMQAALDLMPELGRRLSPAMQEAAYLQMGIAYLRVAETENCVHCRTGESCVWPIRGGGIHLKQEGSRRAIEFFGRVLDRNPDNLKARWLLNVASMTLGEYPDKVPAEYLIPADPFASDDVFPRFTNVAAGVGLDTVNLAGGSIIDDFDGDALLDVLTSTWDTAGQLRFFRNKGDGTFVDATGAAGLKGLFGGLNLVHADYDNDGDLDALVLRGAWLERAGRHPNSLLQNNGRGQFRDVTFEAGLGEVHYPTQTAAWADYDNDRDLDLFIGNEGYPCQLFENDGRGHFRDVSAAAGVQFQGMTKGVVWGDYNADRWPDVYLSNLPGVNCLYRNNRDGTFTDVAAELGVTGPDSSFPVWFWDYNNDGALDLYVSSYEPSVDQVAADYLDLPHDDEPDCLYEGDGKGGFRNVARERGLTRVTQPMGSNFADVDHDGFLDFYLGTGYVDYDGLMPNLLFHNRAGQRFDDVTTSAGVGHLQKGHGVAFGDLDNDGDQDLFAQMGGWYRGDAFANALFENPGFGNHWITIRLVGKQSNRFGLGARIRVDVVEDGTRRSIYRWVNTGGSFGGNPFRQQIGLGRAATIATLEIYWPTSDITQTFHDLRVDRLIEITEGRPEIRTVPLRRLALRRADRIVP